MHKLLPGFSLIILSAFEEAGGGGRIFIPISCLYNKAKERIK